MSTATVSSNSNSVFTWRPSHQTDKSYRLLNINWSWAAAWLHSSGYTSVTWTPLLVCVHLNTKDQCRFLGNWVQNPVVGGVFCFVLFFSREYGAVIHNVWQINHNKAVNRLLFQQHREHQLKYSLSFLINSLFFIDFCHLFLCCCLWLG